MKTAILVLFVAAALFFSGCAMIQDSTELVGRSAEVYTEATELQEKLAPYIEDQAALADLNRLLIKTKLMLKGEVNSDKIKEIRAEATRLTGIFREEATRRWGEIPVEVQAELDNLDRDLIALDLAVDDYLKGYADAVATGKKTVDFSYYAFKIFKLHEGLSD